MAVHAVFITLYFLSTFAVIIMVLERARSESLGPTRGGMQHAAKTWGTAYGQPRNALGV